MEDYLDYCDDLGFLHRFSGTVPQNGILVPVNGYNERGERVQLTDLAYKYKDGVKTNEIEPFFWKVLTDRRMYGNDGQYLAQKVVSLNDTTESTVTNFAKKNDGRQYDAVLSMKTADKIAGIKKSTRKSALETYTEAQYNAFGWASYNNVITAKERQTLFSRYADFKHNNDKYPVTRWGEAVIHSTECPDVIMYVKGSIETPHITKIVRINTALKTVTEDTVSLIREEIVSNEWNRSNQPYQSVEDFFGYEVFTISKARDYASFWQYQDSLREGRGGKEGYSAGEGLQDGEGSHRSGVEGDRADGSRVKKSSSRDSKGRELTEAQQEFFKDSKVRDGKGNLMEVYHGTTANFNIFKRGDVGFHFGTKGAARGRVGYGKNVTIKAVYLNITNPITFDEDLGSWDADYRLTEELYDRRILSMEEAVSILRTDDGRYKRSTESANKKLVSILTEKGYDGIVYKNTFETKSPSKSYIVFSSNQAKETTNLNPTTSLDIRYQRRGTGTSNRSLLANALESTTQNDSEARRLREYKANIDLINAEEQKLYETRQRIEDLSASQNPQDAKAIKRLQEEATRIANRINIFDKKLLNLEATAPLKAVLERERQSYADSLREVKNRNTASRKRNVEGRKRTVVRNKIKRVVTDLNGLLNRGTKERNVKTDMQETLSNTLLRCTMTKRLLTFVYNY